MRSKASLSFLHVDSLALDMLRSSDIFRQGNPDVRVREIKNWLASKGVRDFEPVSLNSDQLKKVRYHFLPTVLYLTPCAYRMSSLKSNMSQIV